MRVLGEEAEARRWDAARAETRQENLRTAGKSPRLDTPGCGADKAEGEGNTGLGSEPGREGQEGREAGSYWQEQYLPF